MPGLYGVLSPGTRSTLTDIALIFGIVIASATVLTIVIKVFGKYIWRPFRWVWRRAWGRNESGLWMTPSVRFEQWLNNVMQPAIADTTQTLAAQIIRTAQDAKLEMGKFRTENADQHAAVEQRLAALEASNVSLSDRMIAIETAFRLRAVWAPEGD